ncbi:MAG TPA: hypothetical protein VMT88_09835 [Actinomycetes bacterium]|nr:hypothetical protein [Actinomycetes bacterium]
MTGQAWRRDTIGWGRLAWLYVIPHAAQCSEPAATVAERGYTITEEAQSRTQQVLGDFPRPRAY